MQKNRLLLRKSLVLAIFLVIASVSYAAKPNIIYIMADDLGYGDLSCLGQEKFVTPNIDRLAKEGMTMTNHYSGSTVCAPSRCVLMTGQHTGHCYIRGNKEQRPVGQHPLAAGEVTVAELLKKDGYATGCFGKWGLGPPKTEGDPIKQGFDRFFGYNCQRNAHTFYPKYLFDQDEKLPLDGKTYSHTLIMEEALKWVKENKDGPFFCYLPVTIPHAAMHVPEKYAAPFRKKFPEFEDKIGRYSGPTVKNPIACFAGMVTLLDEDIGRLMALLKELKIDDNTLVLFTSDNGPHSEGGHNPKFFNSNGPFRGIKRDLYEGGIHVPFLARWPGKIAPNSKSDLHACFYDFLPTACEVAGIKVPSGIDGISYLPALLGKEKEQKKHEYLYWEFYEGGGKSAIRKGNWKAVRVGLKKNPDAPVQLFDLSKDIEETKDLAKDNPEIVEEMLKIFKKEHTPSEIFKMN